MLGLKYKNEDRILEERESCGVPYLSFPALEQTSLVNHGFSTRLGGVSKGCWSTMNISTTRGDDPAAIEENTKRIARAIGVRPEDMVFTHQTHTTNVAVVGGEDRGRGCLMVPTRVRVLGPVHGWSAGRPSSGRLDAAF